MNESIRMRVISTRARTWWLIPLFVIGMGRAYGQQKTTPQQPAEFTTAQANEQIQKLAALGRQTLVDLPIGTGDVLHVEVFDVPELARDVRVDSIGMIGLPLIPGKIQVAGLTPFKAQGKISDLLRENGLVSHPEVSVVVKEQNSQPVAVVGAVLKAQVLQLVKPTTLLEILADSGGVADDAGAVVLVVRRSPLTAAVTANAPGEVATKAAPRAGTPGIPETTELKDAQGNDAAASEIAEVNESGSQTISIRLKDLLDSGDPTFNIPVYGGDIVSVPRSGIVYVSGAVQNPGGYVLQSRGEQVTALRVVALAHGITGIAKPNDAVIVRKNVDTGQTQEIPVKLKDIMNRKVADVRLMPNDILIVPDSFGLKALRASSQAATTIATAAVIYHF